LGPVDWLVTFRRSVVPPSSGPSTLLTLFAPKDGGTAILQNLDLTPYPRRLNLRRERCENFQSYSETPRGILKV
jgi:hypothetical protein